MLHVMKQDIQGTGHLFVIYLLNYVMVNIDGIFLMDHGNRSDDLLVTDTSNVFKMH